MQMFISSNFQKNLIIQISKKMMNSKFLEEYRLIQNTEKIDQFKFRKEELSNSNLTKY